MMESLKKVAVGAGLCAVALLSMGAADRPPYTYIEEVYEVQDGDTLEGIGKVFIVKNTYGARFLPEFIEGIKQNNEELVKSHGQVEPGQKLRVTYWVKGAFNSSR